MEYVSIRDFKTNATKLLRQEKPIIVFRSGKPAGVFIPWKDLSIDDEIRQAALEALTARIGQEREAKGITEEEVLDHFAAYRKDHRGR